MTENFTTTRALERILCLTAFTAGAVDIISFAGLGGVFASAMTGNLAFLGLYLARFSFFSALGSALALVGFVAGGVSGTLLCRGQNQHTALTTLLAFETVLLIIATPIWLITSHHGGSLSADVLILLLSVSMGVQSIVGKRVNLSNIPTVVFTSTLTNIVIAITDMLATGNYVLPKDTKRQCVSFLLYFLGALCAGYCVFFKLKILIFLPVAVVAYAFALERGRSE